MKTLPLTILIGLLVLSAARPAVAWEPLRAHPGNPYVLEFREQPTVLRTIAQQPVCQQEGSASRRRSPAWQCRVPPLQVDTPLSPFLIPDLSVPSAPVRTGPAARREECARLHRRQGNA